MPDILEQHHARRVAGVAGRVDPHQHRSGCSSGRVLRLASAWASVPQACAGSPGDGEASLAHRASLSATPRE